MAHAKLFSPSKAAQWMICAGAPALERHYPNTSSKYADEGTAAHTLGSDCLEQKVDADSFIGRVIEVEREDGDVKSSRSFTVDTEMATNVQVYLDLVRSYVAQGYALLVEQTVSFRKALGSIDAADAADAFGTADAILISPDGTHLVVIDLKYGMGVKVYAENNHQMLTYGLATTETHDLLGSYENVTLIVCQPRLDHIDVWDTTLERLKEHGRELFDASMKVLVACERNSAGLDLDDFLVPGEKQCFFCKAQATCPALQKQIAQTVFDDFAALDEPQKTLLAPPPKLPANETMGAKLALLDMVENWVSAVRAEGERLVFAGVEIIGPDNLPMKVVEGKKGNRTWLDEKVAEGMLIGALPPEKAYKPREIITPSAADKLLNKKRTKETWAAFVPLYSQAPGKPKIALGSDPRPSYDGDTARLTEFVDLSDPAE